MIPGVDSLFFRKPKLIRIAELAFHQDEPKSQAVSVEFAAECIKTLLDTLINWYFPIILLEDKILQ